MEKMLNWMLPLVSADTTFVMVISRVVGLITSAH